MPIDFDLPSIASEIKAAQDTACQIEPFTARLPGFDITAAYEAAHLVHRMRLAEGARAVGRKIGFTNPDMWVRFGVHEPIWSYIYDTTVVHLQDSQCYCLLNQFTEPKIEPEIIFKFDRTPEVGAGLDGVVDALDWVAHGFEIVQSHFPGWVFQVPDTIVDWSLHGTLLIGPPRSLPDLGDDVIGSLESFRLTLSCDGQVIETGKGSNVLGSPLAAIVHLSSLLDSQPAFPPLQAGEIVTTGTITTAQTVRTDETWRSELEGIALPGLTVAFSP